MSGRDALRAALQRHVEGGGLIVGEAVGVHGVTEGFTTGLVRTPLSENATIGVAAGLAMAGKRVVVELVDPAGLARAADAIADLASLRARSEGAWTAPVVIRAPFGPAPAGVPVAVASTAADLVGMLAHALDGNEPTVILETEAAHEDEGDVVEVPPLGAAVVRRAGSSCTVLAVGDGVPAALALDADVEVVDLRALSPIDAATVGASVRKTGRAVAVGVDQALLVALREAFLHLESPLAVTTIEGVGAAVAESIHY